MRAFILVFLCWLFISNPAQSSTIHVVTEVFPPYQELTHDGKLVGYSVDVADALFAITGDTPVYQVMPWGRAYQRALHEENTMIFSMAYSTARAGQFHWIAELHREKLYLWGLKDKFPDSHYSLQDLKHKRVALRKHSNPDQTLQAEGFTQLQYVAQLPRPMNMLFKERVDLILGAKPRIRARAEKFGFDVSSLKPLHNISALNTHLAIALNGQSSQELVIRFKQAANQLEQTGILAAIKEK